MADTKTIFGEREEQQQPAVPFSRTPQVYYKNMVEKMLFTIPGFEVDRCHRTMFLLMVCLPGGIRDASAILTQNRMSADIQFDENLHSLDPNYLGADVASRLGSAHVINHMREAIERFIATDPSLSRIGDRIVRTVNFPFSEKADNFLFNPVTGDREDIIFFKPVFGKLFAITSCWMDRKDPIIRGLRSSDPTPEEQLEFAMNLFPGLASATRQMRAATASQTGTTTAAMDYQTTAVAQQASALAPDPMLGTLLQRLVQQDERHRREMQELRSSFQSERQSEHGRIGESLVGVFGSLQAMSDEQRQEMSANDYMRLFDNAYTIRGQRRPPHRRTAPQVVTVNEDDEDEEGDDYLSANGGAA